MLNYTQACINMISQQLRTNQVQDPALLDLIRHGQREDFVPKAYKEFAYADLNIPLGDEQVMMLPTDEARMLQALQLKPSDHVLEVGTGSGYVTSLLALMSHHVVSLDIRPQFTDSAHARLQAKGYHNIELKTADIFQFKAEEDFDAIVITGAMAENRAALRNRFLPQLHKGGRLFIILGQAPVMDALLFTKSQTDDTWQETLLFETVLPSLDQVPGIAHFRF